MSILSKKVIIDKGDYVIVDNSQKDIIPISCPICTYLLRNINDAISYREFKCCDDCSLRWAQGRREEWSAGWRPQKEEIREEKIKRRNLVSNIRISDQ